MHDAGPAVEGLTAMAEWMGLPAVERAPLWAQRFAMNAPELERFRRAATPQEPPYVAQAVTVQLPPLEWGRAAAQAAPGDTRPADAAWQAARQQPEMHWFTYLPEQAPSSGLAGGYLAGLPMVVKDMIGVAGMPCTGGSASSSTEAWSSDSAAVAALKQQGAVIIGLANLHELAFGASSANPVYGRVINPLTPERIPGGSSGGSAAVVAAGIVDVALGTDTGGSVRIPAACCGVVGFKPSYDAVSRTGVIDISASLDHVGPIGRSVGHCAQAFAALTGLPYSPPLPDLPLQGLRVGLLGGFFAEPLSAPVRAAVQQAVQLLQRDGAQILPVEIEDVELAPAIQFMTISTEAATALGERLYDHGEQLGEDVRVRLEMASFLPGHWYLKAQRLRRLLAARTAQLFEDCDVLLCPVMRAEAPLVGAAEVTLDGHVYPLHTAVSNLTLPFSLSGVPALALPAGHAPDGAALSVQLVGALGQDWQLLRIAKRLEQLLSGK
ncbi:amidase [Lampropedia aestuarii]|uniref:amidase n=1 Tax=Lampropedia aestuarii TaxID=2562762 RepID=UPI002468F037|nr:amidase [Lampropedia aestuarii]MDH5858711.1 amidase [Lampropedia aestuarii]